MSYADMFKWKPKKMDGVTFYVAEVEGIRVLRSDHDEITFPVGDNMLVQLPWTAIGDIVRDWIRTVNPIAVHILKCIARVN